MSENIAKKTKNLINTITNYESSMIVGGGATKINKSYTLEKTDTQEADSCWTCGWWDSFFLSKKRPIDIN